MPSSIYVFFPVLFWIVKIWIFKNFKFCIWSPPWARTPKAISAQYSCFQSIATNLISRSKSKSPMRQKVARLQESTCWSARSALSSPHRPRRSKSELVRGYGLYHALTRVCAVTTRPGQRDVKTSDSSNSGKACIRACPPYGRLRWWIKLGFPTKARRHVMLAGLQLNGPATSSSCDHGS